MQKKHWLQDTQCNNAFMVRLFFVFLKKGCLPLQQTFCRLISFSITDEIPVNSILPA